MRLMDERKGDWYIMTISVQRSSLEELEKNWKRKEGTFVCDWIYDVEKDILNDEEKEMLHCVYVKEYIKSKD